MKYFIQYPLYETCNLRCAYCLHGHNDITDVSQPAKEYQWTLEQYREWRNRNLYPGAEIVLHLATGEPCFGKNVRPMERLFIELHEEKFDILTNATIPMPAFWSQYANRIQAIGATCHRKTMTPIQMTRFGDNVRSMRDLGLPVYVKELLIRSELEAILRDRDQWSSLGIPVKLQHYCCTGCKWDTDGRIDETMLKYVDDIYRTYDFEIDECRCRAGYEGIIIRMDGRVLTCWHDQRVIGSIQDCTYMSGARVVKQVNGDDAAACHVYMKGEAINAMYGKTLGDMKRHIQKLEEQMQNPKQQPGQSVVDVPIQTYLFSLSQRFQDAINHLSAIVNEMLNVISQQNDKIISLDKQRIASEQGQGETEEEKADG
jgi:hypothetical protein